MASPHSRASPAPRPLHAIGAGALHNRENHGKAFDAYYAKLREEATTGK